MKRIVVLLTAALLSAAMPAVADAQGRGKKERPDRSEQQRPDRPDRGARRQQDDDGGGRPQQRAEREIPLSQLIRMVESRTGGEYVNANPRMQGGRKFYWMRLRFPGGRFEDFMVDAATGSF